MPVHIFARWLYNLDPGIASRPEKKNFKNDFRNVASSASNRKSQTVETKQKTKQTSMPKNRLMPKNQTETLSDQRKTRPNQRERESVCLEKQNSIPIRNYQWHAKCQADKNIASF